MTSARTWMAAAVLVTAVGCEGTVVDGGGDGDDVYDPGDPGGDPGDRPLYFYYGPMKLMPAETILHSVEAITGHDFGRWDYTAPDPASGAFVEAGNANGSMYPHCRLLGGCMEHRIPQGRTSFVGTAYVLQLEKAVAEACYDRDAFGMFPGGTAPGASLQAVDVIEHQYALAFSQRPTTEDLERSIEYFADHLAAPELSGMSALESAGRGHCRALLTSNRFLFY